MPVSRHARQFHLQPHGHGVKALHQGQGLALGHHGSGVPPGQGYPPAIAPAPPGVGLSPCRGGKPPADTRQICAGTQQAAPALIQPRLRDMGLPVLSELCPRAGDAVLPPDTAQRVNASASVRPAGKIAHAMARGVPPVADDTVSQGYTHARLYLHTPAAKGFKEAVLKEHATPALHITLCGIATTAQHQLARASPPTVSGGWGAVVVFGLRALRRALGSVHQGSVYQIARAGHAGGLGSGVNGLQG